MKSLRMSGDWQKKDWASILADYSSEEDSDLHDTLNVRSVQRNAQRVTEILHAALPNLDPSMVRTPPMGTNNIDFIREGLSDAIAAQSRDSRGCQTSSSATSSDARPSSVPTPQPSHPPEREEEEGVVV
jgi:hypothetical protein